MIKEEYIKETKSLLQAKAILSLATVSKNGQPHASKMLFVADEDFVIYMITHITSLKYANMQNNSKVGFSIGDIGDNINLQGHGEATTVKDIKIVNTVMDRAANKVVTVEDFWPPLLRIDSGGYVVIKITPTWLRALDMVSTTISEAKRPFYEFELNS